MFVWHHLVPTPGLCTWPVVRGLPPSFSLPRKEQPSRQPAQKELPERRGVLTPTPSPQRSLLSQPCTQPFSLSSPGCSQQSMEDTVQDCSRCRHWQRKVSSPPELSFLKLCFPLTTSWHAFSFSFFNFFFPTCFDHITTWLVEFEFQPNYFGSSCSWIVKKGLILSLWVESTTTMPVWKVDMNIALFLLFSRHNKNKLQGQLWLTVSCFSFRKSAVWSQCTCWSVPGQDVELQSCSEWLCQLYMKGISSCWWVLHIPACEVTVQ